MVINQHDPPSGFTTLAHSLSTEDLSPAGISCRISIAVTRSNVPPSNVSFEASSSRSVALSPNSRCATASIAGERSIPNSLQPGFWYKANCVLSRTRHRGSIGCPEGGTCSSPWRAAVQRQAQRNGRRSSRGICTCLCPSPYPPFRSLRAHFFRMDCVCRQPTVQFPFWTGYSHRSKTATTRVFA